MPAVLATPTGLNSLQTTVDDDDNVIINLTIDMTTTSSCFVCWLHLLFLLLCMTLSGFIFFNTFQGNFTAHTNATEEIGKAENRLQGPDFYLIVHGLHRGSYPVLCSVITSKTPELR